MINVPHAFPHWTFAQTGKCALHRHQPIWPWLQTSDLKGSDRWVCSPAPFGASPHHVVRSDMLKHVEILICFLVGIPYALMTPFSHQHPQAQYGGAVQGARSGAFDVLGAGLGYGPNSPFGPDFWGSKNGPGPNGAHGPNGAYGTYGAFGPYGLFGPYGNGLNGLSGPSAALGPFGYLYESLGYGIRSTNSFWGHNLQLSCNQGLKS